MPVSRPNDEAIRRISLLFCQDETLFPTSALALLPVCFAIRLSALFGQSHALTLLRLAALVVQIVIAGWAACGLHEIHLGPLALDPLRGCWLLLWVIACFSPALSGKPVSTACGALGLICASPALSLICFMPCLIEGQSPFSALWLQHWKLGLLAPGGCLAVIAASIPALSPLTPAFGLIMLPVFVEQPVLAYALLVPELLAQHGFFWPVMLCVLGGGLCLSLPVRMALTFWPVLLLGLTLSARAGGLPDSALAGGEAFILALALGASDRITGLLRTPLPPLAGFLPFWLGLHCVSGLAGLSPSWTAGAMILSLTIGLLVVRAWLETWQSLSREDRSPSSHTVRSRSDRSQDSDSAFWADRSAIPALTLGLCLSICPGLMLGLVHEAILHIAGAPQELWRSWPIWSVAGGDGAFWYPALIFALPALLALTVMPHLPAHLPAHLPRLTDWPLPELRLRLPWDLKRIMASRRHLVHDIAGRMIRHSTHLPSNDSAHSAGRLDKMLSRQILPLWLVLLAIALAWLGWRA